MQFINIILALVDLFNMVTPSLPLAPNILLYGILISEVFKYFE